MKKYVYKKVPIIAGMQFGTNDNKLHKVGYKVIRLTYDSPLCDFLIKQETIKQVIY